MKATITIQSQNYYTDFSQPLSIAIPLRRSSNVNAFHLKEPEFEVVKAGNFVGDVKAGGSCNVEKFHLSPHGNGTHTECLGHISHEPHYIKDCLIQFHFSAKLISVPLNGKKAIDQAMLNEALGDSTLPVDALIIRTLPNQDDKLSTNYSGTHPPYFMPEAIDLINQQGIHHLLTDLPSLDHEDDPNLMAHHHFFQYPANPNREKTITEFVFVPNAISDGFFLLNLQVLGIESDASPSRPILYPLYPLF